MTPNELDIRVKDLNIRVDRVEQILPTLATKQDVMLTRQDLLAVMQASEQRLVAAMSGLEERLRTHMRVLHEDVKSDVRLLAEHLAGAIERWDRRS